jgi:hypothetical protein
MASDGFQMASDGFQMASDGFQMASVRIVKYNYKNTKPVIVIKLNHLF